MTFEEADTWRCRWCDHEFSFRSDAATHESICTKKPRRRKEVV